MSMNSNLVNHHQHIRTPTPKLDIYSPYTPLNVNQLQDQFSCEYESEKEKIDQLITQAIDSVNNLAVLLRQQHHKLWANTFVKLQVAIEQCQLVEQDVELRKIRLDEFVSSIHNVSQLLDVPPIREEQSCIKHDHGDPLERNIVIGFISSFPILIRNLLHDELHLVMGVKYRAILRAFGQYMFLAHVDNAASSELVDNVLSDLINLLQLIFGHSDTWSHDHKSDLNGCQDIIDMLCTRGINDPYIALKGIQKVSIGYEAEAKLDQLLVYLESMDGICNNATMILVGDAVIFSRFEQEPTRQILHLHKARPLIAHAASYIPIFLNASWFGLLRTRLATYTLVVLYQIEKGTEPIQTNILDDLQIQQAAVTPIITQRVVPLSKIQMKLKEFEMVFTYAKIDLPLEPKPILIRQFSKRETLLFMHLDVKSGTVTFPTPRPVPDFQMKDMYTTFWRLYTSARSVMQLGIQNVTFVQDAYKFIGVSEGNMELYVLVSADAIGSDHAVKSYVDEIVYNLKSRVE